MVQKMDKMKAKVYTELRKYHKTLENTVVANGEKRVASNYPMYNNINFPKSSTLSTNEKLDEWMKQHVSMNEVCHLYGGTGARLSRSNCNRAYGAVCSALYGILMQGDIKRVDCEYSEELRANVLQISTSSYALRAIYRDDLEGFLYIETYKISPQRFNQSGCSMYRPKNKF